MAVYLRIKEVALLLYIIGISQAERDLLDNIRLNAENPPEVNDFLHSVLQHRNDFRWIRRYAQQSEPADFRKSTYVSPVPEFFKRSVASDGLRPVNDVQPYVYENSQDDASDFSRSRKFSRRRGRPQRRSKKRRGLSSQRHRRSKGSLSLDLNNSENDNGEVKIVPRSQAGVLNVPGQKYFGRHRKSTNCDEPDHNQHDVIFKNKTDGCRTNDTKEGNEYYYTSPHDLLGLSQDMIVENDNKNKSCTSSTKRKSSHRKVRNSTNNQAVPIMLPLGKPMNQAGPPIKLNSPSPVMGLAFTAPTQRPAMRMFQQPSMHGSLTPLENPYPMLTVRTPSTPSVGQIKGVMRNPGNTDFIKLVHYIDSPVKDAPFSKQELLGKDTDDLLENIDHVLKADRSGLHMYKGMNSFQQPATKKKEESNYVDMSTSTGMPMFRTLEGHPMLQNILGSRRILPVRIANIQKRTRSICEKDLKNLNEEDEDENLPEVELKFNSHPIPKVKAKKPTARRRINLGRKKKKKTDKQRFYPSSELTTPTTTMRIPSSGIMFTLTPNDNNVVNDPNIKLLENADDDNNKNLKLTLKEYLNRENAYNMEKQQQEQEEDENAFDYNNVQQKKVELEDLTEPTSAAEQRELGRKDEPATPSMNESGENDNQFIVIPLKKDIPLDPSLIYTKTEYDNIRSADGGFKVKEAEDVIHLGKHASGGRLALEKSEDAASPDKEPLKKRNLLQKPNVASVAQESPSILNLESEDYAYDNSFKDYKIKPEKQDYNYYENFEQKREVSQSDAPAFKGRKLQNLEVLDMKGSSDDYLLPNGGDHMVSSLTKDLIKRSEDDEPDEEPGNDIKEPHYKHKKVQENEPLDLSPKIEETETLHMDVIDPKRRSFVASMDKVKLTDDENIDKKAVIKDESMKGKRMKFDFKKKKHHHHHKHNKEKSDRSVDDERDEDDEDDDDEDDDDEDMDEANLKSTQRNAIHRGAEDEDKKPARKLHKGRPISVTITSLDDLKQNDNLRIGKGKHPNLVAVKEEYGCPSKDEQSTACGVEESDTTPSVSDDTPTTVSDDEASTQSDSSILSGGDDSTDSTVGASTGASFRAGSEKSYGGGGESTTCLLISAKPFNGDLATVFGTDDAEIETTCTDAESTESSKKQADSSSQSKAKSKSDIDACDVDTSASIQNNDNANYGTSTDNNEEKQLLCCYIDKNKIKNNKQNNKHKKQNKSGDGDDQIQVVLMKRGKAHTDSSSDRNENEVSNEDKEQEDFKDNLDKDESVEKIDKDDSEIDSEQEGGKHAMKQKEEEDDEFRETNKAAEAQEGADTDDREMAKPKKQKAESDDEFEEEPDMGYKHESKGKKFSKAQYTNKLESEKEEKYLKNHPGEEEKMKELQDYEEQAANSGMKGGVRDFTSKDSDPFKDTTDKRELVRSDDDLDDDDSDDFDDTEAFENDEISKPFKLRSPDFKGSSSTKFATSSTTESTRSTTSEADEDVDSDNGGRASTHSTSMVVATTKSTTEDVDFDSTVEDGIAKKSTTEGATKSVDTFSKNDNDDESNSEETNSEDSNSSEIVNTEERSSQDSSEEYTEPSSAGSDTDKGLTFLNITISMVSGKPGCTSEVTPDGSADDTQEDRNGPSEEDLKELTKSIVKLVKSGKFCNKDIEDEGSTCNAENSDNANLDSTDSSDSTAMPTEGTDGGASSKTSTSETSNFPIEFTSTTDQVGTSTTSTCSTESLTGDNTVSRNTTGKNPTSESDSSTLYECSHKLPEKPTFAPIKDEPIEESDMMAEPKKDEDGKNKPILIKSSTVVQINSQPQPDTESSSTIDADDAIPQHIDEGDIKDIIASQYPKLPVALVPKRSHFVEELAEEEIQENDKRNMLGKNPGHLKNQEALVENLQKLINRYKNRIKGNALQNRDIFNMVHHHSEKKKQKSIPKDPCITEPGSYYDRGTSEPVKREATSDNADDDDDELDFYHEKRIYHNRLDPLARPIKEAYIEAESVDDSLKEKMIFQKVYDTVVRSKKKVHNPEVYKIIDEYFDNTQQQSEDDQPVCPVDDSTENIEIPVKRKQEYEELQKEKEEDEDATEDTGGGLVDVIRARKKTIENFERKKKKALNQKKSATEDSITPEQAEYKEETRETTQAADQTDAVTHEPKVKLDNVDSFKDVIEHPIGMFVKRRTPGSRQLQNLNEMSDTYLSPMDEEQGYENRRLRRKLRYLRQQPRQAQAPDRVIPFNYNDYIQNHRQGRHFGQEHDGETNFHDVPNSNPSTEADTSVTPARMKGLTVRSDSSNSTGPNCDMFGNGTKGQLSEEEQKKKEREDMRNMLNGDLPMHMINVFYNKLRDNAALYNRFGGSISSSKECSFENVMNIKNFREEQAKVDIKHAEEMLHEVIVMLNRIVADQVHRKTCLKLSPNLKLYIIRITKGMRNFKKNNQIAEGYPLPKIKYRSNEDIMTAPPEQDEQGQLLFDDDSHTEPTNGQAAQDKTAVRKRIKLIEKLLEKYQRMSMRCQVQVEPVRNYLMDHLQLLMKSLEKSEALSSTTCAPLGFHGPKEPQISEEDLEPPKGIVQVNVVEDSKDECPTTIKQRSIQLGNEPESEIAHRQQVLMETQLDQKKLDEVNQFMAEQQREQEQANNTPDPRGYKQDQQRGMDNPQEINAYKDYRRSEEDNPQKGNRQASPPGVIQQQPRVQQGMPAPQQQQQQSNPQPSFVSTMIDKSKYTNPDLVNKDLFALGLGGINTYLPPFSVSDMVKDIKTTNRVGGMTAMPPAEPTSYGNTKVPPLPPSGSSTGAPSQPKPRSDPILEKMTVTHHPPISLQKERAARSERYKRVPGEDGEEDSNEDAASKIRQLYEVSVFNKSNLKSKNRELQDIIMSDVYSKPLFQRKRALNPYQQPMEEIIQSYTFKPSRSKSQEDPFKAPQDPLRDIVDLPKVGDMEPPKLMEYEDMNMLPRPKVVPEMIDTAMEQQMQQMALMPSPDMAKSPMRENQAPPMDEANNYAMPPFNNQNSHVKTNPYRGSQRNANAPKTKKANMRKVGSRKSEWNGTAKYKKLMEAYESLREKRQNEERLAKLFGSKDDDKLALKTANKQIQDISKVNFEKPLVFSLDA